MASAKGRRPHRTVIAVAGAAIALLAWTNACVGDDPSSGGGDDPARDGGGQAADGAAPDAPNAPDFSFEPETLDVAPGETATLLVRGSSELASVLLTLTVDALPDGNVPASGVTLGASSVSLATGEATISVQASPNATQQRFRVVGTAGAITHEARGRITGKSGELDLFFGDRGGYFDSAPLGKCEANAVAVQPDGRFVVAGTANGGANLLVARFTPDGAPDPSFGPGGDGAVMLAPGIGPRIELMPDGAIAIAAIDLSKVKLFRVDGAGVPDPVWGGKNGITTNLQPGELLQPAFGRVDAKIYVAGQTATTAGELKRYLADAGLDPSFGTGGTTSFSLPPYGQVLYVEALASEPDGMSWVAAHYKTDAGPPYEHSLVRRFYPNGAGEVEIADTYKGPATALLVAEGKAIVSVSEREVDPHSLNAFRVSNQLDESFGTDGRTLVAGPPGGVATSMVLDASSRIYIVNGAHTTSSFEVFRLTPDGKLDSSFGTDGAVREPAGRAFGAAVSGRQLLVVGVNHPDERRFMRIARFWL